MLLNHLNVFSETFRSLKENVKTVQTCDIQRVRTPTHCNCFLCCVCRQCVFSAAL